MDEYTVGVEEWEGYKFGDKVTVTNLDENDIAVLIKVGILVSTTKKVEENQSGHLSE